jgi:hypothetical protein
MLHIAVAKMNQYWTTMGAVERILALSQIRQQDPRLCFVQVMVGFD